VTLLPWPPARNPFALAPLRRGLFCRHTIHCILGTRAFPASTPCTSREGGREAACHLHRRGYDWTQRFQPIADALATLPADDLILDGEAVVADSRGVPDFGLLHADLAAGRKDSPLRES
jgi:hypothetical protein